MIKPLTFIFDYVIIIKESKYFLLFFLFRKG